MADFKEKSLDALLDQPSVPDDTGAELILLIGEYLRYRETLRLLDGSATVQHPAEPLLSGLGHAALGQWDKAVADLDRAWRCGGIMPGCGCSAAACWPN